MHTARRNIDLTYLVMNNQIYGLTTGQVSPTSRPDMKTKSTPFGNLEYPINPITSAMNVGRAAGAGVRDHLHVHLVPRWDGDTSFMSVVGDTRVVPEEPTASVARLRPIFERLAGSPFSDRTPLPGA